LKFGEASNGTPRERSIYVSGPNKLYDYRPEHCRVMFCGTYDERRDLDEILDRLRIQGFFD